MRYLIDESGQDLAAFGYKVNKNYKYGVEFCSLKVDSEEKSKKLGFQNGQYYIINSPLVHMLDKECMNYTSKLVESALKKLITKNYTKILLVGIGNPSVLADALGTFTLDEVILQDNVYKICPNVYSNTGMQTFDFIKFIASGLNIDLIILIDSLATSSLGRIGTSFQLNTAGISPGSGVKSENKTINENNLDIDCIVIGVPFMINANSLAKNSTDLILAPKDVHEQIETASHVLSNAINRILNTF